MRWNSIICYVLYLHMGLNIYLQMIAVPLHLRKINLSGMNHFYGSLSVILYKLYCTLAIALFRLFWSFNSPIAEVLQCLLESKASSPSVICSDGLSDTDWLSRQRKSMTGCSTWPTMVSSQHTLSNCGLRADCMLCYCNKSCPNCGQYIYFTRHCRNRVVLPQVPTDVVSGPISAGLCAVMFWLLRFSHS